MPATYETALEIAQTLSKADRERLARRLLREVADTAPHERVSILELEGLGKASWAFFQAVDRGDIRLITSLSRRPSSVPPTNPKLQMRFIWHLPSWKGRTLS
jgi:hypothetical protein